MFNIMNMYELREDFENIAKSQRRYGISIKNHNEGYEKTTIQRAFLIKT